MFSNKIHWLTGQFMQLIFSSIYLAFNSSVITVIIRMRNS